MKNRVLFLFFAQKGSKHSLYTTNAIPNLCSSFFSLLATARFQTNNVQKTITNANVH